MPEAAYDRVAAEDYAARADAAAEALRRRATIEPQACQRGIGMTFPKFE
jgi:hypothetical protein